MIDLFLSIKKDIETNAADTYLRYTKCLLVKTDTLIDQNYITPAVTSIDMSSRTERV